MGTLIWRLLQVIIDVYLLTVIFSYTGSDLRTLAALGWIVILVYDALKLLKYVSTGEE